MFVQKTYPSVVHKTCTVIDLKHESVLLRESLELLNLKKGSIVVDATLGLGGHSNEILKQIGVEGYLYAFEQDERNLVLAEKRLKETGKNFHIFHDNFASLKDRLTGKGINQIDSILFDLGLSSPHIDDPERGFSFQKEGPLDMRFDPRKSLTAADVLNTYSEEDLADIFWKYGEERQARKLAKAVVMDRKKEKFHSTLQFADFVERVLGRGKPGKHRATTIFQALRIAVNEELEVLELAINQAIELLAPHGRVVVISYHSLEDRIVKTVFKQLATDLRDPSDIYGGRVLRPKVLSLLSKKPIKSSDEEIRRNPRARSAIMRAAEKL